MSTKIRNKHLVRGDTWTFAIRMSNLGETTITGAVMTCNKPDGTRLFRKTLNAGITQDTDDKDRIQIEVDSADTATAEAGDYKYGIRIDLSDRKYTLLEGLLTLTVGQNEGE